MVLSVFYLLNSGKEAQLMLQNTIEKNSSLGNCDKKRRINKNTMISAVDKMQYSYCLSKRILQANQIREEQETTVKHNYN